ncbi:MAG: oxygenase MpaB family protein [Candidatus Limnocylindria bacterium]
MSSGVLTEIEHLDPERDHLRITFLSSCVEFPFDTARALEFALFRTFCSPSVSAVLDSTGEFRQRPQKRYDDTDLLLSELLEHGYDSPNGKAAMRRINRLHGYYAISNVDFLYVLSTFVYEPVRWNARFGWRPLTEKEKLAGFYYWREVGRRMHIRDLPTDYWSFEAFNADYERRNFTYSDTNRRTGEATREMFLSWFLPRPLRRIGRPFIHAVMDEPLLRAFGFPDPPPGLRGLVAWALRARGWIAGHAPPRRRPRLRTEMRHRSYPEGHRVAELGPQARAPDSPFLRHPRRRGDPARPGLVEETRA